jgi:hypothetical protein
MVEQSKERRKKEKMEKRSKSQRTKRYALKDRVSDLAQELTRVHDTIILLCDSPAEYEKEKTRREQLLQGFEGWVCGQSTHSQDEVGAHKALIESLVKEHIEKETRHFLVAGKTDVKVTTLQTLKGKLKTIHLQIMDLLRDWGPPVDAIRTLRDERKLLIADAKELFREDADVDFLIELLGKTREQVVLENVKFQIQIIE